jgi:hypothetical protein
MFRKSILALTAVAALGTVAFTSTEASATYGYGWYGKRHVYSYNYNYHAPACHWQKRYIDTYYGTVVRWVKVCY